MEASSTTNKEGRAVGKEKTRGRSTQIRRYRGLMKRVILLALAVMIFGVTMANDPKIPTCDLARWKAFLKLAAPPDEKVYILEGR